jgi:hypothetical protein
MNCIYFAHCLENLNTAACYIKNFRTCQGHIQPGGNNNGKKRSATETTGLEEFDSFLNGNNGEACGGVDEEEKGNELEEIHQNKIMLDELYTRSMT